MLVRPRSLPHAKVAVTSGDTRRLPLAAGRRPTIRRAELPNKDPSTADQAARASISARSASLASPKDRSRLGCILEARVRRAVDLTRDQSLARKIDPRPVAFLARGPAEYITGSHRERYQRPARRQSNFCRPGQRWEIARSDVGLSARPKVDYVNAVREDDEHFGRRVEGIERHVGRRREAAHRLARRDKDAK
jgi:hypothetical protein